MPNNMCSFGLFSLDNENGSISIILVWYKMKGNLVRGDGMCFLNATEACLLHEHNEVLNIK